MIKFPHSIDIIPGALLFQTGLQMDELQTRRIAETMRILDSSSTNPFYELIPSYASILGLYDHAVVNNEDASEVMSQAWNSALNVVDSGPPDITTIDVVYGDSFGDDLANVSAITGKTVEEVITLHASRTYTVGAVGFTPGFTYLIGLPPELASPRRSRPRIRVPSGSVGIGGTQTGVYALQSAGGWNLIGRSPTVLFDPESDQPVKLQLGDKVQFRPIAHADFSHLEDSPIEAEGDGPIEIINPGMQTTIQDLGRFGHGRSGFATDGAADRASLVAANALLGNNFGTSVLECTLVGPSMRFHRRIRCALAGADLGAQLNWRPIRPGSVFETMPHDELVFRRDSDTEGARAYIAVQGGFDVPLVLGSASTNLVARIGGWHGRALVAGDRLDTGQRHIASAPWAYQRAGAQPSEHTNKSFRVMPGPQRDRFSDETWNTLLSTPFTVSEEANRVGIRLHGPCLRATDGADMLSEGIVTGSIQVTGEGQAIIMLPGHATIGGYTKIATVVADDWDRLGQLVPGDELRFSLW